MNRLITKNLKKHERMKVRYNILTALLVSYVGYTYQATAMSAISPSVPVATEIPDDSIHEPGGMIPLDHHPMVYGPDTTSARQTPVGYSHQIINPARANHFYQLNNQSVNYNDGGVLLWIRKK